jgi:hypothetical protein
MGKRTLVWGQRKEVLITQCGLFPLIWVYDDPDSLLKTHFYTKEIIEGFMSVSTECCKGSQTRMFTGTFGPPASPGEMVLCSHFFRWFHCEICGYLIVQNLTCNEQEAGGSNYVRQAADAEGSMYLSQGKGISFVFSS